jgi:hypothetical protein
VYRITNTKLNKHYYGTRTTGISPCKDLGIKYYSSSSDTQFREDQKNNPQHYKYTIVSEFDSREDALELEIKLHNKFNVGVNESFYNKAKQTSTKFDTTGTKHSDKTINKMKKGQSIRPEMTSEHCDKISKALSGRKKSHEHIQKLKDAKKNVSEETRAKMSEAQKNRPDITKETRAKISEALSNRSKETRESISNKLKGRISPMKGKGHSEEAKRKIGEASKKRTMSEEAKRKIGEASKKRWANLKNKKQ